MLLTVNVNGTPSELSVGPEAITWRRACKKSPAGNKYSQLVDSPLGQLVRRLSSSSLNDEQNETYVSTTPNAREERKEEKKKQIDFNQIIGIKRVVRTCDSKAKQQQQNHDKKNEGQDQDHDLREDTSDIRSKDSPVKLKIYYARRNDQNASGHLLKLKRIIVECAGGARVGEQLYDCLQQHLEVKRRLRPRRLLVFVNPYGGKGRAVQVFEKKVKRLFELARIEFELVVTKYANHARETLEDPQFNVDYFDGIVCVGGDGMFAELMNGLLFRANRNKLLTRELKLLDDADSLGASSLSSSSSSSSSSSKSETVNNNNIEEVVDLNKKPASELATLRASLGGIGERFESPGIPIGVIGAGSTDANLFGFIGTNDVHSATLNIVLGNQIDIDIGSVHSLEQDKLLRFVSTFVAYGYFGDVVRESEKLRWLGPSRYDLTAINNLIRYRHYEGRVRIWRQSADGTPRDQANRCHLNCNLCRNQVGARHSTCSLSFSDFSRLSHDQDKDKGVLAKSAGEQQDKDYELIETSGPFVGVNAAVTACRCPQTRKGFSPSNHLANGCADLILVRPCTRLQYVNYLLRTGYTRKSAFDLKYVHAYRCRQFEFIVARRQFKDQQQPQQQLKQCDENDNSTTSGYASTTTTNQAQSVNSDSKQSTLVDVSAHDEEQRKWTDDDERQQVNSSWNADGEILQEQSIRVKVNQKLLRVFGTGEPLQRRRKQPPVRR